MPDPPAIAASSPPAPILKAMGYCDRAAKCGIRLTLGRHNPPLEDVDWTATVLQQVVTRCLDTLAVSPV